MLDETVSKTVYKHKEDDHRGKRSKEVKQARPIEISVVGQNTYLNELLLILTY